MERAQAGQLGCAVYRRRRPERTPLYRVVQGHFETYLTLAREGHCDDPLSLVGTLVPGALRPTV